jgi:hypothetical protein
MATGGSVKPAQYLVSSLNTALASGSFVYDLLINPPFTEYLSDSSNRVAMFLCWNSSSTMSIFAQAVFFGEKNKGI